MELVADGLRRDGVVAGDHAHVDAGRQGRGHGVLGLGPERVDDADEGGERQLAHLGPRVGLDRRELADGDPPDGEAEHPQPVLRQGPVGVEERLAGGLDRDLLALPERLRAQVEDHVGSALDDLDQHLARPVVVALEGGHVLVGRVERHLRQARVLGPGQLGVGAELGGEHDQGRLGRVADDLAVVGHRGVAGQRQGERERAEVGYGAPGRGPHLALLAVAATLDRVPVAGEEELRRRHLVHREGAGLVGVDRAGRAEGLDVGQVAHDGLGVGQAAGAEGEHPLDEGGHAGGDGRDGHRDAEQQEVLEGQAAGGADGDHDRQRGPGHDAEPLGESVELLLERRLGAVDRLQEAGDLADLGLHAGGRHDHRAGAPGHRGVLEDHVGAIAQRRVVAVDHAGVLRDGGALAGEGGLLGLEVGGADQPPVGGDDVAGLDGQQVAGDHLDRRDGHQRAVPDHPGLGHLHLGQGVDAGPRRQLLAGPEGEVEQDEQEDDEGGRHLADDQRWRSRPRPA